LSVAVPSFITMVLSWAAAGPDTPANAAKPKTSAPQTRRARAVLNRSAIAVISLCLLSRRSQRILRMMPETLQLFAMMREPSGRDGGHLVRFDA
jgi:hypothetical protein